VAIDLITFLVMLACSSLLEAGVQPRMAGGRDWKGRLLHVILVAGLFGFFLAISGNVQVAAVFAVVWVAVLTIASIAKRPMLGEPLVFSDVVLIVTIFRHPQFYFTALSTWQRCVLVLAAAGALFALTALFVASMTAHLAGIGLLVLSAGAFWFLVKSRAGARLACVPDVEGDVARYGLLATLVLYWLRWYETPDPPPLPAVALANPPAGGSAARPPELIVIVQCESFADPATLVDEPKHELSGLALARAQAWQWGRLQVENFGAYTMRTEFGVLFGRSQEALGFRRYDPFLTAKGEASYALPARLGPLGYRCQFVHPHDLRFYGRDQLMPAIGFDQLVGEDCFGAALPGFRYVDDRTLGAALGDLVEQASGPTLIYAVTMENHGPWISDQPGESRGGLDRYLHHVRNSDAMLSELAERLSSTGKSALLVFFGDHRPSIPGVTTPDGGRDTPYVIVRFSAEGRALGGLSEPVDLTPDELHHAIFECILAEGADRGREIIPAQAGRTLVTHRGDSRFDAQRIGA
jgi:hypothetical protein